MMEYSTADTIAIRLSKVNPWAVDETTLRQNMPLHECKFCAWRKPFNAHGMYNTHDPACLWVAAARYADDLANAAVASQEAADSPIESRVDELLGETETAIGIGTRVRVDGVEGIVIATGLESHYGHCPKSMVIVRVPGGDALKEIAYCEVIA